MGLFSFGGGTNINEKIEEFKSTNNSVLLDVRTVGEYQEGHIENSINIPLDQLAKASSHIKDKKSVIYVYCLSGGRSSQAVKRLKLAGYEQVINAGGINGYKGKVVR